MKLSTKPRYGLRILAQIAADGGATSPVSGKEVAQKQGISIAYIEQILIPMRHAGLVNTVRGRNGGYLLARPAEDISLLEIIELFDGRLELVSEQDPSVASTLWNRLTDSLKKETRSISVADLASLISAENPSTHDFMI
ncbi:MAG: Rrf2 family transcriptional regulator [Pontiella sp.]